MRWRPVVDPQLSRQQQLAWMSEQARTYLPDESVSARMYDFVKSRYQAGIPWEQARDEVYQRYQVEEQDGYDITSRNMDCNGCFSASINFAASLVSLFFGEGDWQEQLKSLFWRLDSDNPA